MATAATLARVVRMPTGLDALIGYDTAMRVGIVMLASVALLCGGACLGPILLGAPQSIEDAETVVLLHGLGRKRGSLNKLAKALVAQGYRVCSIGYASRSGSAAQLLAQVKTSITDCANGETELHFVTHSLGGILLRAYAFEPDSIAIGRAVMLAPPNHGSELADVVASSALLSLFTGPVGADLGTHAGSLPNRLGPVDFSVGIIAGDNSVHPIGHFLLDGPNDGTVTVASARLVGMRDFAVVHRAHSFIMRAPEVISATTAFLATGCFAGQQDDLKLAGDGICATQRAVQ